MADKYITREELRVDPYNIPIDQVDNKYLEVMQDLTKDIVDDLCNQPFDPEGEISTPVEYVVSGTGKDTVFLPKRLVQLTTVRIYSQANVYQEYDASNFVAKAKFISWNAYSESYQSYRFRVENFPKGSYNIGVLGVWGWSATPEPIKFLQGSIIKKYLEDGSYANNFKSEGIGDYDYTLADVKNAILGDVALDLIIKRYRGWTNYAAV